MMSEIGEIPLENKRPTDEIEAKSANYFRQERSRITDTKTNALTGSQTINGRDKDVSNRGNSGWLASKNSVLRNKDGRFAFHKIVEKAKFFEWLSIAPLSRQPRTRETLADSLHVSRRTLYRWERDCRRLIPDPVKIDAFQVSLRVVKSVAERAIRGDLYAMEAYLKYVLGMK